MESFNIYENTQLKKAKYANKHFLEILNTQLKFEIPKWMKKEWVKYPIAQKLIKVLHLIIACTKSQCNPIRDASPNCPSSGIWGKFFRDLGTFSGIPNISPIKCCNMLQNALTQELQYLLVWYPHPPSQKHSWQLYLNRTEHDSDSHPGHHARRKSLSYKLHRRRDYLRSLTALVLARDLCILGWTFATFYAFLLEKPFFQTWVGFSFWQLFTSYGVLFAIKNNAQTSQLFTTGVQVWLSTAT